MGSTQPPGKTEVVDAAALAEALSTLGLLYGAREALATATQGATSEADAIRKFIQAARPHLLATYDIDALVALVQAARQNKSQPPSSIEQFTA